VYRFVHGAVNGLGDLFLAILLRIGHNRAREWQQARFREPLLTDVKGEDGFVPTV